MQYPKNLEFIRENGNMGSDGTESDNSKEDGYQQKELESARGEMNVHKRRLKNLRRDYRCVKLAPFTDEQAVDEVQIGQQSDAAAEADELNRIPSVQQPDVSCLDDPSENQLGADSQRSSSVVKKRESDKAANEPGQ
jgi:hypothetical protein